MTLGKVIRQNIADPVKIVVPLKLLINHFLNM